MYPWDHFIGSFNFSFSQAPREEPKSGSWRWLLLATLIATGLVWPGVGDHIYYPVVNGEMNGAIFVSYFAWGTNWSYAWSCPTT